MEVWWGCSETVETSGESEEEDEGRGLSREGERAVVCRWDKWAGLTLSVGTTQILPPHPVHGVRILSLNQNAPCKSQPFFNLEIRVEGES